MHKYFVIIATLLLLNSCTASIKHKNVYDVGVMKISDTAKKSSFISASKEQDLG